MFERVSKAIMEKAGPIGHALFWALALIFYTVYFGQRQDDYGQSLIFIGLLFPITIATTYFLIYWLIPRFLLTRRYGYFILYFSYTLIFSLYLELMLIGVLFIYVAEYQALMFQPGVVEMLDVVVGMYLVVFLGVAIHLLRRWYSMQSTNLKLERVRLETELKLKEAELKLLKSQIHPHFLFNTLNNLYGLTLERSELAPDVVLRISNMLDYMLYRGNEAVVPLLDEVEHIDNYLSLETLRYDDTLDVSFQKSGTMDGRNIAPLLLIPFVENSFKHGVSRMQGDSRVRISLNVDEESMSFTVENTRTPTADENGESKSEGIGLENVRKRLELLYPDAHRLDITESDRKYRVELIIQLDGQ